MKKIKCFLGFHDFDIIDKKMPELRVIKGFIVWSKLFKCKNCKKQQYKSIM